MKKEHKEKLELVKKLSEKFPNLEFHTDNVELYVHRENELWFSVGYRDKEVFAEDNFFKFQDIWLIGDIVKNIP